MTSRRRGTKTDYRQTYSASRTLVGNKLVDHSDREWRCSWSSADRWCANYIFILDWTPGFNGLGKDNYKTRRETFKFLWSGATYIRGLAVFNHFEPLEQTSMNLIKIRNVFQKMNAYNAVYKTAIFSGLNVLTPGNLVRFCHRGRSGSFGSPLALQSESATQTRPGTVRSRATTETWRYMYSGRGRPRRQVSRHFLLIIFALHSCQIDISDRDTTYTFVGSMSDWCRFGIIWWTFAEFGGIYRFLFIMSSLCCDGVLRNGVWVIYVVMSFYQIARQ